MGCNTSRINGLPAVAMCHDRCKFIDEALRQSYAVADAHAAHMQSLKTLGPALYRFFNRFEIEEENNPKSSSHSPFHPHSKSEAAEAESDNADNESQFFNPCRYDSSPLSRNVHFTNYVPSPPPPTTSSWDFLNLFETFDKYQVPYTEEKKKEADSDLEVKKKEPSPLTEHNDVNSSVKCFSEAMKEIQILLERASDSGNPILEMLDVGKLRYHRNIAVNPVSCKMMHVSNPLNCMDSSSLGRRMYEGVEIDKGFSYGNLCSTLNKLCMWENKLYAEVKAEEKLRILHEKKCRQLRRMNKKGADAHKVDAAQTLIGILATKINISFQVVDKISSTICKLREEELWPQINSFIFRFLGMWKEMLECYRCQYKEIAEAKSLVATSLSRKLSNSHLDEIIELKSEIQNWNLSFSDWIYAQKSHVKALNGWLVRCLVYEPEEITDATASFSPGRTGAPPVFVVCTKWSRAMDLLSEKDVIEAVNVFILKVNEILEKHVLDLQQKLTLDKELERKVKILERQEHKMHKVVQARERKMVPVAKKRSTNIGGDAVHHGELDIISLQSSLKHMFAAMERFAATIVPAYEELCQQLEQDNHVLGEFNNIH
ncbi:protein ALTERED PHOSPHATE STARVATION RESPONSE 1-like [Gastrolobium bilobum]|uniref:protein ALTERED PHOSPHATE STARVATION RESPONSE 1-like n=1 Tax=Gastrolobium bilobum TaxID=150636 RepID=UPI002AB05F75|nr:protein ALTERED PHOSPHATE STARVATION RESPONSE 1-like [Gastrolobium bilobum]